MTLELKMAAASKALEFIKDKMIVGLGTGSTADCFIKLLSEKAADLDVTVVVSSVNSEKVAREYGLSVIDINDTPKIDIVVDGADEIDRDGKMIKGGGAALLREKILAEAAERVIIIADSSKEVLSLGEHPLPVEIVPYGYTFTERCINKMGIKSKLRLDKHNKPYVTDNSNYILDLDIKDFEEKPSDLHDRLISVTGVIETGLFFSFVPTFIIAHSISDVRIID